NRGRPSQQSPTTKCALGGTPQSLVVGKLLQQTTGLGGWSGALERRKGRVTNVEGLVGLGTHGCEVGNYARNVSTFAKRQAGFNTHLVVARRGIRQKPPENTRDVETMITCAHAPAENPEGREANGRWLSCIGDDAQQCQRNPRILLPFEIEQRIQSPRGPG